MLLGESEVSQELGVHLIGNEAECVLQPAKSHMILISNYTNPLQRLSRVALRLLDTVGVSLNAGVSAGVVLLLW